MVKIYYVSFEEDAAFWVPEGRCKDFLDTFRNESGVWDGGGRSESDANLSLASGSRVRLYNAGASKPISL